MQDGGRAPTWTASRRGRLARERPCLRNNPAGLAALKDVAKREFVASGYHAISIRDLVREAGVSQRCSITTAPLLHHYYASKQELLYEVLNDAIDAFHQILSEGMAESDQSGDPVGAFLVLIDSTVRYRATLPEESLLFIREFRSLEPKFADRLAVRGDEVADIFADAIDNGLAAGVFSTPHPDDARRAIHAILNAIPNRYRSGGDLSVDTLVVRHQRLPLRIVEFAGDEDAARAKQRKRGARDGR